MRTSGVPLSALLALVLALAAPSARAQEDQGGMGLDLSGGDTSDQETPAEGEEQPGAIGLDLSSDTAGSELLPRVVLLGLATPERAGAAVASRWLRGLYLAIRTNEQWVLSAPLKEVREKLSDGYAAALRCGEASCLTEAADTLDADLLVTSRLALEDDGWTLRLWTYDRDRNRVETDVLTGRSPRDAKFQKAGAELLRDRIRGLARQRAILQVKVNVPQAVVRVGEKTLGVGNVEARVGPGDVNLIVEAEEFSTYAKTITLKPGEKNTVEVYLESSGPAPDGPSEVVAEARREREGPSKPTVFGRPALYTAVVGVLAMGAGVMVGMQAKKIADRAPDADGNGIADITRRERLDGRDKANLSTALLAGGAAAAGGSVLWLVLMPTRSEPAKAAAPSVAPGASSGGTTSLHLIVGGNF
ncbi:PEGA domain-containing protein [Hyalangium sp.]|uniref:PEGA domain-containing protein n=1 Tax=Hyalangium sp. TaxID=2028555 RepID=UPI002D4F723D|nr:PEGA domain-containing protein [Hyalangium sp.]HYI00746.1 PEGA domain-containing protein [Hyalangium sp.]